MNGWVARLQRLAVIATCSYALLAGSPVAAGETSLPAAKDLAAERKNAERSGLPLIVLVSLAGCPHCEVVRRYHLLPLLRDGIAGTKPVIRQVEINGLARLRDFTGRDGTHAAFARYHKANMAPVVFFFSAKGELLTEPLVGAMIPDFYGAYFDAAFSEAKSRLNAAQSAARLPQ